MLALEVKGLSYTPQRLDNQKREQKSPEYLAINRAARCPRWWREIPSSARHWRFWRISMRHISHPHFSAATPTKLHGSGRRSVCATGIYAGRWAISRGRFFREKLVEFVEQIKSASDKVRSELDLLEAQLSETPWLAGDAVSAADLMVFPVVMQLARSCRAGSALPLDLALYPYREHFPRIERGATGSRRCPE